MKDDVSTCSAMLSMVPNLSMIMQKNDNLQQPMKEEIQAWHLNAYFMMVE
jgi:hypothetical protein